MTKILPRELTSYDLLKTLAVLLMITDHVGYYLYPDHDWFRVFGRLCVPMWFFLIGFANTRALDVRLWIGAGVLVAGSVVTGHYILPLNILATMLFVRFTLDKTIAAFLYAPWSMALLGFVMFLLVLPSSFVLEYGTTGYVLAFLGYFVRHKGQTRGDAGAVIDAGFINLYGIYAAAVFIVTQSIMHGFTGATFYVLTLGTIAVLYGLTRFRSAIVLPDLPAPLRGVLKFTGRRTLEIYVIHILILAFTALALGDPRFGLLDWKWMPEL